VLAPTVTMGPEDTGDNSEGMGLSLNLVKIGSESKPSPKRAKATKKEGRKTSIIKKMSS
jgi:hypothetical protein